MRQGARERDSERGKEQGKGQIICFQFSHSSRPGAPTSVDLQPFST